MERSHRAKYCCEACNAASQSVHQSSKPHNTFPVMGRQRQLLHMLTLAEGSGWTSCDACNEASQLAHQSTKPHNTSAAIGRQWQLLHNVTEGSAMTNNAHCPTATLFFNTATLGWVQAPGGLPQPQQRANPGSQLQIAEICRVLPNSATSTF